MADATLSTITPLVDKYLTRGIAEVIYDQTTDPFIKQMQLDSEDSAGGHEGTIVVRIVDDGDIVVSPDLETAGGAIGTYRFEVPLSKLEWKAKIRREAFDAAKGSPRGLFDIAKRHISANVRQSLIKLAKHALTKRGCLGVVVSVSTDDIVVGSVQTATGSTATTDTSIMNRFKAGMELQFADNLATGNLRAAVTVSATIASKNDDTATLSCTAGELATAGVVAGDYIFEKGDTYLARSTRRTIVGVFEWCDWAAPAGSENFLGKDRSLYPNLQAMRFNASGKTHKNAILQARSRFTTNGKPAPDTVWVSQAAFDAMELEADKSTVIQVSLERKGADGKTLTVGLEAIKFSNGQGGSMNCIALPFLENGLFLMGNLKESPFKLSYTDQLVRTDKMTGSMWTKEEISDGTEKHVTYVVQGSTRGAIYCTNPGNWLVGYNHTGA